MKNYSSMEQREAAAPPSTNSVSTEATVAKMVIIKFIVILEVYTNMIFFSSFPVKNNYLGLKHNLPRLTHFKIIDSGGQLFSMKTRILRPLCTP